MGTVSAYCIKCYGSGQVRKRNMIGVITFANCLHCKGFGRRHVEVGGGEWRIAQSIAAPGLGPGIRKGVNIDARHDIKA